MEPRQIPTEAPRIEGLTSPTRAWPASTFGWPLIGIRFLPWRSTRVVLPGVATDGAKLVAPKGLHFGAGAHTIRA